MVHTEITYGDEFIKELIPQPVEILEKPKMYHSKCENFIKFIRILLKIQS